MHCLGADWPLNHHGAFKPKKLYFKQFYCNNSELQTFLHKPSSKDTGMLLHSNKASHKPVFDLQNEMFLDCFLNNTEAAGTLYG